MTKTITAAAFGLVAAASLALSSGTASAGWKPHHYGLAAFAAAATIAATASYAAAPKHQVCSPVYKTKKVWTPYGWQFQEIYVGQSCRWVSAY